MNLDGEIPFPLLGERLLRRAHSVAQAIEDRVRSVAAPKAETTVVIQASEELKSLEKGVTRLRCLVAENLRATAILLRGLARTVTLHAESVRIVAEFRLAEGR